MTISEMKQQILNPESTSSTVLEIMRGNLYNPKLQEIGCNRIRELAKNKIDKINIGNEGGVRLIVDIMNLHINEPLVQVNACAALQKLTFVDSKQLSATGTISNGTILTSKKMCDIPEFEYCSSPEQLSSFCVLNMTKIISAGGKEAILSAMKHHPDHLPVQLYGVCALACFTFSNEYLRLLVGEESKLVLEAAAKRFPAMCSHDARNVLALLAELA